MATHEEDFDTFHRETGPRLARVMRLAYPSQEDLEDDLQETWLIVYQKWRRLAAAHPGERWRFLVTTITRKRTDRLRRGKKLRDIMILLRGSHTDTWLHVEEAAYFSESVCAVLKLPPRQRVITVLHVLADIPLTDIAHLLGISDSSARNTFLAARAKLRDQLRSNELSLEAKLSQILGTKAGQP